MKTILVTGAKGQLGWELEGLSYTHNYKGFKYIFTDVDSLDITNENEVNTFFARQAVDFVINCAAYTLVDKAEEEPEKAMMVNAKGVENLVHSAKNSGSVIIHLSTDYVFDGHYFLPYNEGSQVNPPSQYGKTKLESERILSHYNKSFIIRTSWLYSEKGNNFLTTILRLSEEKDELKVVYDQVGCPTYARDLAKVILDIIVACEKTDKPSFGIYHYSNEGVCSWYDFARAIIKHSGKHNKIIPIETSEMSRPAARPPYSVLNKAKIKSVFQISIPHWEESLISCLSQIEN